MGEEERLPPAAAVPPRATKAGSRGDTCGDCDAGNGDDGVGPPPGKSVATAGPRGGGGGEGERRRASPPTGLLAAEGDAIEDGQRRRQ